MATHSPERRALYQNDSPKSNEHEDCPPPPPSNMALTHHHVPTSSTTIMIPDAAFDDSSPSQEIVMNFDKENAKTHTLHDDNASDCAPHLDESVFDDTFVRSLYLNLTLFTFSILSCYLWFGEVVGNTKLATAYIIAAFSIIILFNSSICGLVLAVFTKFAKPIPFQTVVNYCVMAFYLIGGFFYFVAGCQYAASWNALGRDNDLNLSSFGGIAWTEMFYIAVFAAITGLDLQNQFLDRKDVRLFTLFGLYAFCSMVLFLSYFNAAGVGIADSTSLCIIGVGHLFGFLVSITYLVYFALYMFLTEEFVIRITLDRYKSKVDMVCAALLAFWMLWTAIAYWGMSKVRGQDVVYYFGFGLFLMSMTVLMTFDMAFWAMIEKKLFSHYKDDAVSDCEEEEESMNRDGVVTVNLKR